MQWEVSGISASYATHGHRFHCPGEITIGSASDYAEKLRACHVIVDHEERQSIIRDGAAKAAADAGLTLVEDEGLVIENAGLRSEEHTSELQSLMSSSYAVFCLQKKSQKT